ncbi:MAG: hydroxyisourate hydrolase [Polyangiales bacterium]
MSQITTHVLDTSLGKPAAGLSLQLAVVEADGNYREIATGTTNAEGRVLDLLRDTPLTRGTYRLTFDTGAYFAATQRMSFYPRVVVLFEVRVEGEHHHVPLLLNPYGYSTYRGS